MNWRLWGAVLLAALSTTTSASADDSAVLAEGMPSAMNVWMGARYAHAFGASLPREHVHAATFDTSTRLLLGRLPAYVVGLDVSVGGGDTGFVYDLEAHLLGLGARWTTGAIGVSSGVGIGGAVGSVPLALQVPVEAFVETSLGPLRIRLAVSLRWIVGASSRQNGAHLGDFADEVGGALFVRLGREHAYWGRTVAGSGPMLGVTYREQMGSRIVGVAFGLSLSGGR